MKTYLITTLLLLSLHLKVTAQKDHPDIYAFGEEMEIGQIGEKAQALLILEQRKMLRTLNEQFPKKGFEFDTAYIREEHCNNHVFYVLTAQTKKSNRTLVKWLKEQNQKLILATPQTKELELLSTFFICEGESGCYPRLLFLEGMYGWSCRETSACVSDAFAKQHPCSCTKGRLF